MKTSADIFAAQGYAWNTPNYQHNASPIIRQIEGPAGYEVELDWEIEGYGPDGKPSKAQARAQVRSPERRTSERNTLCVQMRNENAPRYRAPEYRRVVQNDLCGRDPEAQEVVLTPSMLETRKRQQAQVKARLTRAANRIKRERAEAMSILLSI